MLEAQNILVKQGRFELRADWAMEQGGIYALIGPSGAGKSTFLSAVAGFAPLSAGRVVFDGENISDLSPAARPISNIFQSQNLFPRLTIRENIALGRKGVSRDELESMAEKFEISDQLDSKPHEVSGGQAARAVLVRAMLQNKDLWLLDEPFAALGPRLDRELRQVIAHEFVKNTQKTLIFISHQPNTVLDWADFVIWADAGQVFAPMQTADFMENLPISAQKYL